MEKSIISEGKTTNEAIEKGLKELKATKDMVEINVLEAEEKRSFFSILEPRKVKVKLTLKENNTKTKKVEPVVEKRKIELSVEEQTIAENNTKKFLDEIIQNFPGETTFKIEKKPEGLNVEIFNENLGFLIGYRGETLYAFQDILSSVASKDLSKRVRVILDIEGYKEKRKKTLEQLAVKMARIVEKTGKSKTLDPMKPYERKIIHSKLQENNKIETTSVGEEPYRKIVISIKK